MKLNFLTLIILSLFLTLFNSCDKSREEEKIISERKRNTTDVESISFFLFVRKWYGKVGIYKYDLMTKNEETIWWHPRENVNLLISQKKIKPAFFLTVRKTGLKGNFPFFEKVKIYRISSDLSSTEVIYEIKDGMQITAHWNDDDNLEVVFTSIDKTDPAYINRHVKTFDNYGKLINDELEVFNLINDGFPELLPKRNPTISLSGKYGISLIGDSVFLKTAESDSLRFITAINLNLNKIKWSDDEDFLFISTLDLKNETIKTRQPETSELFVYSIQEDSVIASWVGAGVKSFLTIDSLVVFDNGFGRNSSINIYNYIKTKFIDELKINEECGLYFIPEL